MVIRVPACTASKILKGSGRECCEPHHWQVVLIGVMFWNTATAQCNKGSISYFNGRIHFAEHGSLSLMHPRHTSIIAEYSVFINLHTTRLFTDQFYCTSFVSDWAMVSGCIHDELCTRYIFILSFLLNLLLEKIMGQSVPALYNTQSIVWCAAGYVFVPGLCMSQLLSQVMSTFCAVWQVAFKQRHKLRFPWI